MTKALFTRKESLSYPLLSLRAILQRPLLHAFFKDGNDPLKPGDILAFVTYSTHYGEIIAKCWGIHESDAITPKLLDFRQTCFIGRQIISMIAFVRSKLDNGLFRIREP